MPSILINRVTKELRHWQSLGSEARKLLISFSLYEFVQPLIFVFVNAFLLRQGQGFQIIATYNLGWYLSTPATFYLNGWLLKFWSLRDLYRVGALGQGLVITALFFWPIEGWQAVFLFGLAQGVCLGLYWSNRNFMSLAETQDEQRNYFTGLEMLFGVVAGVTTPLFIGLILWIWNTLGWSAATGYQFLGVASVGCVWLAGWMLRSLKVKNPQKFNWLGSTVSRNWARARIMEVAHGVHNGFEFTLPALITFTLIGQESSLSLLQAGAALFSAIVIYSVARKTTTRHRLQMLGICVICLWYLALSFVLFFNRWVGIQYLLSLSLVSHLIWIARNPLTMKIIDDEDEGNPANNYVYVCDRELFLNIGRLIGLAGFFVSTQFWNQEVTLRVMVVLSASMQLLLWFVARQVRRS